MTEKNRLSDKRLREHSLQKNIYLACAGNRQSLTFNISLKEN